MANCYSLHLGAISINYSDAPCEDVTQAGHNVTCCVRGSTCLSNGICKNTNGDGHYTADCTDPTLQDPHCQNHCGGLAGSQITYNSTSGLWACCSYNGGVSNCSEPTDELFAAPSPSDLKTVLFLPKTGTISYSTSATPTSVANTSASSVSSSSSSTISPGTAAGIGAGVGVGILLIGLVVAFMIFKRRKPTENSTTTTNVAPDNSHFHQQSVLRELDNKPLVSEMDTGRSLPELASHS